jgi:hypothetical protein
MERRADHLLRAVVDQVARQVATPGFQLRERGTTSTSRGVEFTAPPLMRYRGERRLRVYYAPDEQYIGAYLQEAGRRGPLRRAMLWSYDPGSTSPTDPQVLPHRVGDWADSIIRCWPV